MFGCLSSVCLGGSGTGEGTLAVPVSSAGASFCCNWTQTPSLGPDLCLLPIYWEEASRTGLVHAGGELLGTEARDANHCSEAETMVRGHPSHTQSCRCRSACHSEPLSPAPGRAQSAASGGPTSWDGWGGRGTGAAGGAELCLPFIPVIPAWRRGQETRRLSGRCRELGGELVTPEEDQVVIGEQSWNLGRKAADLWGAGAGWLLSSTSHLGPSVPPPPEHGSPSPDPSRGESDGAECGRSSWLCCRGWTDRLPPAEVRVYRHTHVTKRGPYRPPAQDD